MLWEKNLGSEKWTNIVSETGKHRVKKRSTWEEDFALRSKIKWRKIVERDFRKNFNTRRMQIFGATVLHSGPCAKNFYMVNTERA